MLQAVQARPKSLGVARSQAFRWVHSLDVRVSRTNVMRQLVFSCLPEALMQ
jgi:hypothetical protein